MPVQVAIVADDLTGAADAGSGFRRAGYSTLVRFAAAGAGDVMAGVSDRLAVRAPADGGTRGQTDVLAFDLETRAQSEAAAERSTAAASRTIRLAGVESIFKKIDSTLRGHVGAEVRAVLGAWHPGALAVVAPAFPAMRRTTVDGWQRLDGRAVGAQSVVDLLKASGLEAAHISLGEIRAGKTIVQMTAGRGPQPAAVVCDAETDADLAAIVGAGQSAGSSVVWVGTGGLAAAVASASAPRNAAPAMAIDAVRRPVLTVIGTATAAGRRQGEAAVRAGGARVAVHAELLRDRNPLGHAALAAVEHHLRDGFDVVVTIDGSPSDASAAALDAGLVARIGECLRSCAPFAGALIVTGGDTALSLLQAWGATGLMLVEEIEPGVPASWSQGAVRMPVVTKAGSFGDDDVLVRARAWLRR